MVVAISPGNRSWEHVASDENSHPSSDAACVGAWPNLNFTLFAKFRLGILPAHRQEAKASK